MTFKNLSDTDIINLVESNNELRRMNAVLRKKLDAVRGLPKYTHLNTMTGDLDMVVSWDLIQQALKETQR